MLPINSLPKFEMTMENQIKIVIADDHSIVRQGLRQMLDAGKRIYGHRRSEKRRGSVGLIETHQAGCRHSRR